MKRVKWLDKECNSCGARLNSWDARISKTLAYKYPCCEKCIAKEYDKTPGELRSKWKTFSDASLPRDLKKWKSGGVQSLTQALLAAGYTVGQFPDRQG